MESALPNRLLLVSSDLELCYAVAGALEPYFDEREDWHLSLAASGGEAELLACEAPYEAVLLDWRCLGGDPYPMLRRLKALMPGVGLVALLERGDGPAAVRALRAGSAAVLQLAQLGPDTLRRALEIARRGAPPDYRGACELPWSLFLESLDELLSPARDGETGLLGRLRLEEASRGSLSDAQELSSQAMKALVEASDGQGLVAQAGHLEFAILVPGAAGSGEWSRLSNRIHEAVAALGYWSRHAPCASLGLATVPEGGLGAEALLARSVAAMKRARSMGGGCTQVFSPEQQAEMDSRMRAEILLRQALTREELRLSYRPLSGLNRGGDGSLVVDFEDAGKTATAPWNPEKLARESGLLLEWTQWMIHQAGQDLRRIQRRGAGQARAFLRLDLEQLLLPGLAQEFRFAAAAWDLEPLSLGVLIGERAMRAAGAEGERLAGELAEAGAALALGAYGEDISDPEILRQHPFELVTLDLRGLRNPWDPQGQEWLRARVRQIHALGLPAVAENVDGPVRAGLAQSSGIDFGLGDGLVMPLLAEQVLDPRRIKSRNLEEALAFSA